MGWCLHVTVEVIIVMDLYDARQRASEQERQTIPYGRQGLIDALHAIELGKISKAQPVCELLRRLLANCTEPERRGVVTVTVPLKSVANAHGMRRYSVRAVRYWCRWAIELGLLTRTVVTNGDWCGNSYAVNADGVRQLAANSCGRQA